MQDQIPTGLPQERDPLSPETNEDVIDPNYPDDDSRELETDNVLTPGFGSLAPEPTF